MQAGAQPYERTVERKDYRNGVKPGRLTTRFGKIVLSNRLRHGEFETCVIDNSRGEYQGILAIMQHLGVEISKSSVF
ncbi:transposase [Methanocella conradii]|uniref:transposase n=1 Tax=Methanocella conradii TaxID=1175444 RepID=UPI0024B398F2|nr:transposase [Methanocella conradii]MDI6898137.1 transposase [Methanocella conradii]